MSVLYFHCTLFLINLGLNLITESIVSFGNLIHRLRKVGARLGQGWGKVLVKVGARSGQKARSGQGLGRQGLGKVRARSGQGWSKVRTKSKVRARSGQASFDPNVFYSYHSPKSISGLYH